MVYRYMLPQSQSHHGLIPQGGRYVLVPGQQLLLPRPPNDDGIEAKALSSVVSKSLAYPSSLEFDSCYNRSAKVIMSFVPGTFHEIRPHVEGPDHCISVMGSVSIFQVSPSCILGHGRGAATATIS